jgi:hypothetical protein
MTDSADYNNASFDIKQDPVISHPQAVPDVRSVEPLDVTMQTVL